MIEQRTDVVLVVDDSPETIRLLTDVLDTANFTVMVALDGASALKVASRLRPNIVLMDAVMPGMDGFETCRQMKMMSGFDNIPIIFMTGLTEESVRGFQAGGVDYVTKPIVIDSMLARIGVHLANARKLQNARLALDATDQYLLAINPEGEILWFTPRAYRFIEQSFGNPDNHDLRLPPAMLSWLKRRAANFQQGQTSSDDYAHSGEGLEVRIGFVDISAAGEILVRISETSSPRRTEMIKTKFNLTPREAEVANWIAQGKSNRDIATILTLSPRTVDKHVEVIFAKLNVENRTAAAALIISAKG